MCHYYNAAKLKLGKKRKLAERYIVLPNLSWSIQCCNNELSTYSTLQQKNSNISLQVEGMFMAT